MLPSEVQTRVSPAGIPEPAQLHDDAGQLTAVRLFAPVRLTVIGFWFAEVAVKLDCNKLPLPEPSCAHEILSFEFSAACEVTRLSV